MVVVMLRIPVKAQEPKPKAGKEPESELRTEPPRESHPVAEESQIVTEQTVEVVEFAAPVKPYGFAVRTNLLYDAFLLPTLGVEWRVNRDIGVKLDGSLAWWGDEHGKVQKMWLISPEVRWYLTRAKRFYVGLGGTVGKANIYGYPMGNMLQSLYTDDTGYQGDLYGAGLTVGCQLCLSRALSLDFNAGVGYTHFEYDSFGIVNRTRVHKAKDLSKDFWGPTQAGISLVWTIGGNKQ